MKDYYEPPQALAPDMDAELIFIAPSGMPFWKKLLIYCGVWVIIIAITCGIVWSIANQYEMSLPTTAMDNYIESSRQDMFFFAISDTFEEIDNRFESAFDISSKLAQQFSGELTYTKLTTEYTHENPVYIIKHNGENLFKVTLEQGEETGFMHFREYFIDNVDLIMPDIFTLSSYKVVFASNMLIHVNNTSLGTDLKQYERIDIFGSDEYYGVIVEDFTFEPKIVALEYEYEAEPDKVVTVKRVGDFFIFERSGQPLSTVTVTAPSKATVTIDGKTVSPVFISEKYTEHVSSAELPTEMAVYTIPTVYKVEKIEVTLNGEKLELVRDEENELTFTALISNASCTVNIPKGATLYLNGKKVPESNITDSDAMWHSDFEELRQYPTAVQYTVSGVISMSDITAKLGDKELVAYKDGSTVVFAPAHDESLKNNYEKQATDFVYQYLFYSTQGYRNTETNLENTLKLVAPSSPLRNYLNLANVGIEYKSPQQMEIEYLVADNFVAYGNDAFVCDVSYKATLNDSVTEIVEENVIRLIFVRSGNGFLPASFIL